MQPLEKLLGLPQLSKVKTCHRNLKLQNKLPSIYQKEENGQIPFKTFEMLSSTSSIVLDHISGPLSTSLSFFYALKSCIHIRQIRQ